MSTKEMLQLLVIISLTLLLGCSTVNTADDHHQQGLMHYEANNIEQAIAEYDKAIALNPDFVMAYNNRGIAYYLLGDLPRAIEDFDKALQLNPDLTHACYNRGNAHHQSGNIAQAIRDFERYLELAPDAPNREAIKNKIERLSAELVP